MSIKTTVRSHFKVVLPLIVIIIALGLLSLFILNNRPSADVAVTPPVISGVITWQGGVTPAPNVKVDLQLTGKKYGKKYSKILTDTTDSGGGYGFPKSSVDGLRFDKTATINA